MARQTGRLKAYRLVEKDLTKQARAGIINIETKEREEREMTIRELREMLEQFDDDMRVQIVDNHWNEDIDDVDEYDGIVIIRA